MVLELRLGIFFHLLNLIHLNKRFTKDKHIFKNPKCREPFMAHDILGFINISVIMRLKEKQIRYWLSVFPPCPVSPREDPDRYVLHGHKQQADGRWGDEDRNDQ